MSNPIQFQNKSEIKERNKLAFNMAQDFAYIMEKAGFIVAVITIADTEKPSLTTAFSPDITKEFYQKLLLDLLESLEELKHDTSSNHN
jgi:hypothetical protein